MLREDVAVGGGALADFTVADGAVDRGGIRANVRVALAYLDAWLQGTGAAAIDNLMEDAATAEISPVAALAVARARHAARRTGTSRSATRSSTGSADDRVGRLADAADLLDHLVLDEHFADFLTHRAYAVLG